MLNKERLFWLGLSAVLLFLAIFSSIQNQNTKSKLNLSLQKANKLQQELAELRKDNLGLSADLKSTKQQANELVNHVSIDEYEINLLKQKGLPNPVLNIRQDLKKHPELIKYDGVLGGTMGFYFESGIHVLNRKWVLADFDDGHINGFMLLRYDVKEGGRIKWHVIEQYLE